MKLVKLDKDYSIKLKSQVTPYLNPDYIYIPINDNKITFKKNDEVRKGSLIFDNIYSPVSGHIIGIKECITCDGVLNKCLVIANDFQEQLINRVATRRKINNLSLNDIIDDVNSEIARKLKQNNIEQIIISGIDDEPYIANEIFIQKENTKIILETIDALVNFFGNCKTSIVIKNVDGENIEAYSNFLGTYKNIELKLVDDLYLLGEEKNLIEKLNIKGNYLYLNASEVYELYSNIKKRKPLVEKYVTITGNGISDPQVFEVKYGTKVSDLINSFYDINFDDFDIYVNGLMRGKKVDINKLIVTKDFDGLIIMKKDNIEEKSCIKCGKCIDICPINSNPLLAYKKDEKVVCINCGLCTYICPSYINLRKYLNGDSNE